MKELTKTVDSRRGGTTPCDVGSNAAEIGAAAGCIDNADDEAIGVDCATKVIGVDCVVEAIGLDCGDEAIRVVGVDGIVGIADAFG